MAALRRTVQLQRAITTYLNNQRSVSSSVALQSGWNKDWMPSKFPATEEERQESARRHGLLPEDYRARSPDDDGHGDYPEYELIGEEQKSPWTNWDDPYLQRNFGEPLHLQYESIMVDKGDPGKKYRLAPRYMFATFLGVVAFITGTMFFTLPYSLTNSKFSQWYPYDDMATHVGGDPVPSGKRLVHYTFEPAE